MGRPTSVTVAAILSIVFGALGIFAPLTTFPIYRLELGDTHANPAIEAMLSDEVLLLYTRAMLVVGAVAAALLCVGGIRMLKLSPWGRKVGIGWALYALLSTPVGIYMNVTRLLPAIDRITAGSDDPAAVGARIGGYVGLAFGTCSSLALAITILLLLTRPSAVAAFRGVPLPDPPLPPA